MRGKKFIYIARNVTHRHARDEETIYVHVYLTFAGLLCHYIVLDNESEVEVL